MYKFLVAMAAVLIAFGAVIVYLFGTNPDLARWMLAIFLFGHGWVHISYVIPQKAPAAQTVTVTENPFRLDRSWVFGQSRVDERNLRSLGTALVALVMVGFTLAALSTVGLFVPTAMWGGLLIIASVGSLALLGVFFNPGLVLGVAINIALLWIVLGTTWTPVNV